MKHTNLINAQEPIVMKILHLTLKKQWFDMIASGEKREEYRVIKKYWTARIFLRDYDVIKFRNGYRPDSPTLTVEYKGYTTGFGGEKKWGAQAKYYYRLQLGAVISKSN